MHQHTREVTYLNGIRGIAAFLVFVHHFCLSFYPAYFDWKGYSNMHGLEIAYGKSLFSVLTNGIFYVHIFFVLSGFVLSRAYFHSNKPELLISGMHRRFLRLYLPVAFTLILSYTLLAAHLYASDEVSHLTHSEWWLGTMCKTDEPFHKLIACLGYRTMFLGDNTLDTCMWTMSVELYGSFLVFAFMLFTHFTQYRSLMLTAVMGYFYLSGSTAYLAFALGMSLCYTERHMQQGNKSYTFVSIILLPVALILGSYSYLNPRTGTFFEHIGHTVLEYTNWYHVTGAYLLMLAFVISRPFQWLAGSRAFSFLGHVSFPLYLLHPLLIGTFSCQIFLYVYQHMPYNYAALTVFTATIAILFAVSWLMNRYIDQNVIQLAKRMYRRIRRPEAAVPAADTNTA